ncbi:MAG: hypothetical protein CVV53_01860 [Spirochaetae bacterium HGW-Spirochaetae-9]|nr:MAG: hypothetical protein CVV53_01860 [Spirochaetae bacterium HGW-Spirochaetae-9]
MEKQEFNAIVGAFEHAYDALSVEARGLSPAQMSFVPPIADAWSINEHLVHLLDADCNLVLRVRGAVAEPGRNVPVWNQEAWRSKNNYSASDGLFCLDLAVSLRKFLAESLRTLDDATREAASIVHPEKGPLILPEVLKIYTGHADFHYKYLIRNLEAFARR